VPFVLIVLCYCTVTSSSCTPRKILSRLCTYVELNRKVVRKPPTSTLSSSTSSEQSKLVDIFSSTMSNSRRVRSRRIEQFNGNNDADICGNLIDAVQVCFFVCGVITASG